MDPEGAVHLVPGDGGAVQGAQRALPAHHRHPLPRGRQGERRHHLLHRQEHQGLIPTVMGIYCPHALIPHCLVWQCWLAVAKELIFSFFRIGFCFFDDLC